MSDAPRPCDFCGAPVVWTQGQRELDLFLKLKGLNGLGVSCPACDERIVALEVADEERFQREEAEWERDNG